MRKLAIAFLILLSFYGVVQTSEAQPAPPGYYWNHPYWRTHPYGYWRGRRGYWAWRHRRHFFIIVN